MFLRTRDSQKCHEAISLKSHHIKGHYRSSKFFNGHQYVLSKCLVKISNKMSHKNVLSKYFIKMSYNQLSVLSTIIRKCILSVLSVLSVLSSIIHHPSSINVYFLYFLYFLPSSIIHHPSMNTFCKTVQKGKNFNKNRQKQSKRSKTVKNVQTWSKTV